MTKIMLLRAVAGVSVLAACSAYSQLEDVQIHGFISQGYMSSTDYDFATLQSNDGTFHFNEAGINFSADLTDQLRAGVQLFSRDYGSVGNNEVVIDWAYGDYSFNDYLGFRAGRVKSPLGLYNESRDIDVVRNSVLLPNSVYYETMRDLLIAINGAEVYGMLPVGPIGNLQYKAQAGYTDLSVANSGLSAFFANEGLPVDNIDTEDIYGGSLVWLTPVDGLRFGTTMKQFGFTVSGTRLDQVPVNPADPAPTPLWTDISYKIKELNMYTLSVEYLIGNWTLAAEGVHRRGDVEITRESSAPLISPPSRSTEMYEQMGGYLGGAYRFNEWFELGSYYSYLDERSDNRITHDLAVSTRFDINDFWLVKLEGHWLNGSAYTFDNSADDEDWYMFTAKTTFSF